MLPMSEFHFAFCGIATVAATLGYACARRAVLSLASPNESSKADVETGPPEERSLKRKLSDSDEHDVDAEEQSRPMKRNRTPPTDQHESDDNSIQEWEVVVAPPPYEQAASLPQPELFVQDNTTSLQGSPHTTAQDISLVREPTPPARPEALSQPNEKGVEARRGSTPEPPQVNPSPNEPGNSPPRPPTPATSATKIDPVNAFSAFSGSSSPFASYSNTSGASPFAISGQIVRSTPAWKRDNESESDVCGQTSSANALAPLPNIALSSAATKSSTLSQSRSALGHSQPLVKSSSYLTGEEDEDVEAELKGVKLFIRRGRKEFTDGMYGHIKILSRKSTPKNSDNEEPQGTETEASSRTRLLFRRDPLGQVSMNAELHPTVRCHFDPAENILRVIMMEQMTTDGENTKEDVAVYALKPGRTPKADFQSFAKTLCDHKGLQSGAVAGSTASANGDAAAP